MALTRIFSIAYGYHFAFLAMSLGLLGFGMSGTLISLRPRWRERLRRQTVSWLALGCSLAYAGAYLVTNSLPLDPYRVGWDPGQIPLLGVYLGAYAVPFLLAGLVQGLPITSWTERASRLYAASLTGSGAGALLALGILNRAPAPQALLWAALGAALAAPLLRGGFGRAGPGEAGQGPQHAHRRWLAAAAALPVLIAGVALAQPGWMQVQISEHKPLAQLLNYPGATRPVTLSNAQSQIDLVDSDLVHSAPGLSLNYQGGLPDQAALVIDGDRVLPVTRTDQVEAELFDALPTALAYRLRPGAPALVLQPGAGLEVAAARHAGAEQVTAVEANPRLVTLLRDGIPGRTGDIYRAPGVQLVAANPRAWLAGSDRRFGVVSLALSEGRRSVTAGAFSLSEDFLLTGAALDQYLGALDPQGLLVLHRWLQLPPTEEVRTVALAAEALERAGADPARSLVAIRSFSTMLILAQLQPFSDAQIEQVREFAAGRQFDLVHYPGIEAAEANRFNVLERDRYFEAVAQVLQDRQALYREYPYDVRAPSDDRPFYFHFFRWEQTPAVIAMLGTTWQPFGGSGYLLLLGLLGMLVLVAGGLILAPALIIRRREPGGGASLRPTAYFSLLGLGFLMVEVALVGRFMLVLDHPAQAFAVVLFGLLGFSGLGSLLSGRIPWRPGLGLLAALLGAYALGLSGVLDRVLGYGPGVRVAATLALLAPLGLLMGIAFPRGLAWIAQVRPSWVPMAWAVNGFTSVIGAVLAALAALSWGYSPVLIGAAGAYLVAALVVRSAPAAATRRPEPAARR